MASLSIRAPSPTQIWKNNFVETEVVSETIRKFSITRHATLTSPAVLESKWLVVNRECATENLDDDSWLNLAQRIVQVSSEFFDIHIVEMVKSGRPVVVSEDGLSYESGTPLPTSKDGEEVELTGRIRSPSNVELSLFVAPALELLGLAKCSNINYCIKNS